MLLSKSVRKILAVRWNI